ncbi:MAG TPA: FtsX-like permease family protein [Acidimicrobiales bacterium]|nr:FtsX-like permease family protein [Acidimicrobiales bacterium]
MYLVRLRHGSADLPRFAADVSKLHVDYVSNQDALATAIAGSIHPQAVGWWLLAALAALAGLVVVGQALGRQSVVESEEYPTLRALGFSRRRLVVLGMARNLVLALVGAGGAVVVAFVLSPLTPVGEARLAEPSNGLSFDPLVLLLGALATVIVVLLLGVWPALRASRVHMFDDRAADAHPSTIVAHLAAAGAPPSAVIGVRHALERGRGAASVPVGTALFGTAFAVMALCATAVFGASLSHLTATPALYGDDFQVTSRTKVEGQAVLPRRWTAWSTTMPSPASCWARGTRFPSTGSPSPPSPARPSVGRCSCRW